jgi:hypothetical protein
MAWSSDQLERIGQAPELQISSYRRDGSLRRWTPIWVVRIGDHLYIRSALGHEDGWYRNAMRHHAARIRAGDVETDVTLQLANDATTWTSTMCPNMSSGQSRRPLRGEPRDKEPRTGLDRHRGQGEAHG